MPVYNLSVKQRNKYQARIYNQETLFYQSFLCLLARIKAQYLFLPHLTWKKYAQSRQFQLCGSTFLNTLTEVGFGIISTTALQPLVVLSNFCPCPICMRMDTLHHHHKKKTLSYSALVRNSAKYLFSLLGGMKTQYLFSSHLT